MPIWQEQFVKAYFAQIVKYFSPLGFTKEELIGALWAGTKNMLGNDGVKTNRDVFWQAFVGVLGQRALALEAQFEDFYLNEFNTVKSLVPEGYSVRGLLDELKAMGYTLALATNPVFPRIAVESRLGWIGASKSDFVHITSYENSSFSKPNVEYYRQIFKAIGKEAHQCLMVGNNVLEDMCVSCLGAEVFLVTEYIENEKNLDISAYRQGNFNDLLKHVKTL